VWINMKYLNTWELMLKISYIIAVRRIVIPVRIHFNKLESTTLREAKDGAFYISGIWGYRSTWKLSPVLRTWI
jgi:hypothetical protein